MNALLRRAVQLFPRTDYLSHSTVRHARREWVKSVMRLHGLGKLSVISLCGYVDAARKNH